MSRTKMQRGIVILICGLPGSGKSYFAGRLADATNGLHLSSDRIRREYFERKIESPREAVARTTPAGTTGATDREGGRYSARNKAAVYDLLFDRMRNTLSDASGQAPPGPVLLDANFGRADFRARFRDAAQSAGALFFVIHLVADENTTRRRIQRPRADSDADFAVYLKLRDAFEAPRETHLRLASDDASIEKNLRLGLHYVYGAPLSTEDIQILREGPAFAQGRSRRAELIETHISWVLLGESKVYKIKKPVRYSFLDFSTLMRRYHYCREELRLNSRLSDIYTGVRTIRRDNRGLPVLGDAAIAGSTPIIGFAVEMKRIDNRYEMDRMLAENSFRRSHARQIAVRLARFHREAAAVVRFEPKGGTPAGDPVLLCREFADLEIACRDARAVLAKSDRRLFQPADGASPADRIVNRACEAAREFLQGHADEIHRRRELGLVRDCHGDCHSRNIFLPPGGEPILFDCIEFSAEIRRIDLLNEIAFLCMDLEARGHAEMIEGLLEDYLAARPAPDVDRSILFDPLLFAFFLAYRANIRAKVALLRLAQCTVNPLKDEAAVRAVAEVESYLELMDAYVSRFAAPRVC